jgi:hypothetical protein
MLPNFKVPPYSFSHADPAILHDWPLYEKSFIQAAKRC